MSSFGPYLPHTESDVSEMLSALGKSSIEELFDSIPPEIRLREGLPLAPGLSEWEVSRELRSIALRNRVDRTSFLGGGSYDHIIPATVRHVLAKPEFSTAYTPYQAEISQGILQAIFEFQTMMCMLTGLDVSNASLYDGATAAVEACAIGLQTNRRADTILVSETVHPNVRRVLSTNYQDRGIRVVEIEQDRLGSSFDALKRELNEGTAAVVVQSPNYYGFLEDYAGWSELIHDTNPNTMFVVSANPMSLPLLRSAGEWGADIGIGDTQVFGFPANYGGPSAGYITAREALLRKMPGRIVGQTVDREGRRAFVLTLQAREQHIKRERATSNICTNQALVALGNAVYLATLGEKGLKEVASQNHDKARYLHNALTHQPGVETASDAPFFNEFTLRLSRPAAEVIETMADRGYLAGFAPSSDDDRLLTVAVTEKRNRKEMDQFVNEMREILK